MMDSSFLKELAELEHRFNQFSVVGTDAVVVSGNLRTGLAVNVRRAATTGSSGDAVGACCFEDGTCSVETGSQCIDDGGIYYGSGTSCSPNPCPVVGACCYDDGTCDDLTEADCDSAGGNWQGPDTTCDDDPPPCPSPLPPCSCGFDAFDGSGRKFLTKTTVASGSYDSPPPPGCTGTATNTWSSTRVDTIDPDTCEQTCVSATGSASVDVPWTGPFCSPCTSTGTASCSGGTTSFCGFGSSDIVSYTGCSWTFTPICNSGIEAACALCSPSSANSATENVLTWACNPAPGNVHVNATQTITLSDECMPDGFSPPP